VAKQFGYERTVIHCTVVCVCVHHIIHCAEHAHLAANHPQQRLVPGLADTIAGVDGKRDDLGEVAQALKRKSMADMMDLVFVCRSVLGMYRRVKTSGMDLGHPD